MGEVVAFPSPKPAERPADPEIETRIFCACHTNVFALVLDEPGVLNGKIRCAGCGTVVHLRWWDPRFQGKAPA